MIGEFDVGGVFIPSVLVWAIVAFIVSLFLRRLLILVGFYRLVWHRSLVDLSFLVIILAVVAAVLPHWIAP